MARSAPMSSASPLGFPARSSAWGSGTISRCIRATCSLRSTRQTFKPRSTWPPVRFRAAEANLTQQTQNLQRQTDLYRTRVNALQDLQNAQDSFESARAQLASAKANLELAKLNLSYTKVVAPVEGYVTNMNTSPGTYVTTGNQLMALVDTSSFWIAGYFKETQLPHIEVGQNARITLMGHEGQPFQAVVRSVGWGIFVADGAGSTSTALLPAVDQTIDWVRLPQRFPVRLQVAGPMPMPLRIGQTVSVAIIPEFEPVDAPKQPSLAGP